MNYIKENIVGYIFLILVFAGMYAHQTYSSQSPLIEFHNVSLPAKGYNKYDPTKKELDKIGYLSAMQLNSNPNEFKLYLTKDLQMIWVSNIVADKLERIRVPHITTDETYINYCLTLEKPYIEIISYSNVDFNNIKQKQKKNLSIIVQEFFAEKTNWVLKDTYKEIMGKKFKKNQVKDFSLDDMSILKKGNNICITFNEETINPYYELDKIDKELEQRNLPSQARKTFLEANKPKQN
jgi:hypothetical protein